ncbi:hypothetical protein AKJ42_02670 [candidate division MSBL1 archaeon SCGC-AAA261C02]|uniref:MoaB/Mog domain-containing protein n=1 Tax=candidate division MSBL1 archaeon SCGC-AAA261C02 TaxID=1698272 RepID=A0A133UZW3_9EURY|nr:hypothetical protein AKJ42_02670 [candidate division MSBL1 archaeon SCGC-AAA261C02]
MSGIEHREEAPKNLHVGVITTSDSRAEAAEKGEDKDLSGPIIQEKLEKEEHSSDRVVIPDDEEKIKTEIMNFVKDSKVDAVITTGGTGITSRDKTVDVARSLFEKELPGFGETLRRMGYEEVGGPGILTRATAGLIKQKPVFCLPGAPNAVKIAMDLILPDLGHLVKHARE